MKINELYNKGKKIFSIEVIPPRNGENIQLIDDLVSHFSHYDISYYSVTWGAGGSLRGGTLPLTSRIITKYGVEAMAHFTCRDFSKQQIENILIDAKYLGIDNVLALRGDPPQGDKKYTPHADGYQYATELVDHMYNLRHGKYLLRTNEQDGTRECKQGDPYDPCIAVACYPEGHPEAESIHKDWEYFKMKVDKGANLAITQMIFDVTKYIDFANWCKAKGITIPIIPGVYPLHSIGDLKFLPYHFHVSLPYDFVEKAQACGDNKEEFRKVSLAFTAKLVQDLLEVAPGVHFYSMNNQELLSELLDRLQLKQD